MGGHPVRYDATEEIMFTYTNRRGVAYYVHEARTKAGARRYVVKRSAEGALAELPAGMEIVENVNGQISVRAARERVILPLEERMVQEALARHGREKYRVEVKARDIVVYEPDFNTDDVAESMHPMNAWGVLGPTLEKVMRKQLGDAAWEDYLRQKNEQVRQGLERAMRYSPVLRFRLDDASGRLFSVERMGYSGDGGWVWLKGPMPLVAACERYMPLLGTDKLFEDS